MKKTFLTLAVSSLLFSCVESSSTKLVSVQPKKISAVIEYHNMEPYPETKKDILSVGYSDSAGLYVGGNYLGKFKGRKSFVGFEDDTIVVFFGYTETLHDYWTSYRIGTVRDPITPTYRNCNEEIPYIRNYSCDSEFVWFTIDN